MQLNSDEKMQKIFNQIQYSQPNFLCGSNNKITLLCIDKQCKAPSLHCQHQECTFCQPHHEASCSSLQLRSLVNLMKKKMQNLKHFVQQLIKIESNMIKSVQNKRNQLFQKVRYGKLSQQEIHIVQSFFKEKPKLQKFKGSQIVGLVQKIKKNNQTFRVDDQLRIFERQISQITDRIFQLQKTAINEITKPTKHYAKIDSKIMEQDPPGLRYILQQLHYPNELKLLYRASQHGFSSLEFHNKCDNIPNTLTIIKTQNKKILAEFTPLKWEESGLTEYKRDPSLQTFVLSVTLRQKYQLLKAQCAIRCVKKYGPAFGLYDFVLLNGNPLDGTTVHLDFPSNFNCKQKYEKGKQTIMKIAGQDRNKQVNVDEYEVYQVVKK